MIACGSKNGFVHLMEVSENMTFSAKNDKAILNAVSKVQDSREDESALPFMLDRENKREKILEALIESAESEFYQLIEEENQRRVKEQEAHDQHEKHRKSPKVDKKKQENEEDDCEESLTENVVNKEAARSQKETKLNGAHHENTESLNKHQTCIYSGFISILNSIEF
ncbi:CLUMA_CG019287, isoform A [Clunio marinus]|uniref:CLUMA_CG019287, isoform A n=1 Tax=Clunio marinus TaxID=568069 RepID=A0A1J1J4J7_9DIPT|nr:CLUMA_CG019287, isoform A [Clunio marinus]